MNNNYKKEMKPLDIYNRYYPLIIFVLFTIGSFFYMQRANIADRSTENYQKESIGLLNTINGNVEKLLNGGLDSEVKIDNVINTSVKITNTNPPVVIIEKTVPVIEKKTTIETTSRTPSDDPIDPVEEPPYVQPVVNPKTAYMAVPESPYPNIQLLKIQYLQENPGKTVNDFLQWYFITYPPQQQ